MRVLDNRISDLDTLRASRFKGLFHQKGFEGGIDLLADILQQDRLAELDSVLQNSHVIFLGQSDHVDVIILLHVLHPFVGLALGIDHQRPSAGIRHDYRVVDGEEVGGQAEDDPGAYHN